MASLKLSGLYKLITKQADKIFLPVIPAKGHKFWHGPLGPKTVFFWAPAFKWGLVIAGLGDINRPASQLSVTQSGSLAATGIIWSRYSLVIIPKNYSLFAVNVFVGLTQCYQLFRAYKYQQSQKTMDNSVAAIPASQK